MFLSDLKDSEAPRTMYRNLFCTSGIFAKKRDSPPGRPRSVPGCRGRVGGEGGRGQGEVVSLPPWAFPGVEGSREGGPSEDSFAPGRILIIVVIITIFKKIHFFHRTPADCSLQKVERERERKRKREVETRPRNPPPPPPLAQRGPPDSRAYPHSYPPPPSSPPHPLLDPLTPHTPKKPDSRSGDTRKKVLVKTMVMIMIMK